MRFLIENYLTNDEKALISEVCDQFRLSLDGVHGIHHWLRVLRNGMLISENVHEDIDHEVLFWFCFFHDSQRFDECRDALHGVRASEYISTVRSRLRLSGEQIALLKSACEIHSVSFPSHPLDPTVACCLDADRLDLMRVSMKPEAKYLVFDYSKNESVISERSEISKDWDWDDELEKLIGLDFQKMIYDGKLKPYL